MNLEDINSISSIIGTLAIVLTLIILARDLRQNTKTLRANMAREAGNGIQAWYSAIGNNQNSAELWTKGMANPDNLSQAELLQFFFLIQSIFWIFQTNLYLSKEGSLDSAIETSISNVVLAVKDQPGFEVYWKQRKDIFFPEFKEHIDKLLTKKGSNFNMGYSIPNKDE